MSGITLTIGPGVCQIEQYDHLPESDRKQILKMVQFFRCQINLTDGPELAVIGDNEKVCSLICWIVDQIKKEVHIS